MVAEEIVRLMVKKRTSNNRMSASLIKLRIKLDGRIKKKLKCRRMI